MAIWVSTNIWSIGPTAEIVHVPWWKKGPGAEEEFGHGQWPYPSGDNLFVHCHLPWLPFEVAR